MLNLDIELETEINEMQYDENKLLEIASYILENERKEKYNNDIYISLLITNNERIKKINAEYRNKNIETDVLSFAYNETENVGEIEVLGDIVISFEKVLDQSKQYNHSVEREFYYVFIHAILHILGYDHIAEDDKIKMREKEEYYLSKFNYKR